MSEDGKYIINAKDVVFTDLEKEAVVLNLRSKYYFTLNETGLFVWQLLQEPISEDEIVNRLTEEFNAESKVIEADVAEIMKQMKKEGLISASA